MAQGIAWYAKAAGLTPSESVRELISRGLVTDRSTESGYRNGYREGKLAAWHDHLQRIAAASAAATVPSTAPRGGRR